MANVMYPKGLQAFLDGDIDYSADTIKAALVDTGTYTYSSSHQFYSSVSSAVVGTPVALSSKTSTNGVADAADLTFTGVSGSSAEAIVIYKDTGNSATSPLICFLDSATGLPVTPTGGDLITIWNASGIFSL